MADASGLASRRQWYGANVVPRKPPATFLALCLDALEDTVVRILCVAGTVSLVLGLAITEKRDHLGYIDGIAMYDCVVEMRPPSFAITHST